MSVKGQGRVLSLVTVGLLWLGVPVCYAQTSEPTTSPRPDPPKNVSIDGAGEVPPPSTKPPNITPTPVIQLSSSPSGLAAQQLSDTEVWDLISRFGLAGQVASVQVVTFPDLLKTTSLSRGTLFDHYVNLLKSKAVAIAPGGQRSAAYAFSGNADIFLAQSDDGYVQGWALMDGSRFEVRAIPGDIGFV
jgi:hypothetical protein